MDDWAAFGISLWTLQRKIKEEPAYISEAVDILVGLRIALPKLSEVMRKYATDVADMVAGLCCDCIRGLADDCHWDARQVAQTHPIASPRMMIHRTMAHPTIWGCRRSGLTMAMTMMMPPIR